MREVDADNVDGHSCDWCLAFKHWPIPFKVLFPVILAGVEQSHDLVALSCGVNPGYVRLFLIVARETRPSEILCNGGAAVLLSDDVIYVE